jgi:4-amino-4-deoxy-L-arabinose transferase-like glycosyltransferase
MTEDNRFAGFIPVIIGMAAMILFIPFLGDVHLFDWDEINFAESAREMIVSKDYLNVQINYLPFWEKPPLFIWLQVISMKLFGINEFAARFPNAICGIGSLLVLYFLGKKHFGIRFGVFWVMLYAGSLLPFFYFKSGIIDPWFNIFIFLAIYFFYLYSIQQGKPFIGYSAFFIGLAVLTKGPVAVLIFLIATGFFLWKRKDKLKFRLQDVFVFILILSLTGGLWFILQIFRGNFNIIVDFIQYQIRLLRTEDAGHGGFILYHFVVLFLGVFPASILALPVLLGSKHTQNRGKDFYQLMLMLFWVVLILFTLVNTKIVHYSSLCYFPLTFLAAWAIHHDMHRRKFWKIFTCVMIVATGLLLAVITMGITFLDSYKHMVEKWFDDPFALACLTAHAGWKGYEFIAGGILLLGIVGFVVFCYRDRFRQAVQFLALVMPLFMFSAMMMIVPRIEMYSQHAAIEFFSSLSGKDVYLDTIGYKSYAHFYYGHVQNHPNKQSKDEKWLLSGAIDKDVYFSIKVNHKENFMLHYPEISFLYQKDGFAFFKRERVN